MNYKKIVGGLFLSLLLVGMASAAYMFFVDEKADFIVESGTPFEIAAFENQYLNTSVGIDNASTSLIITNNNGILYALANVNETRLLNDPGCTDFENDCNYTTSLNGETFKDQDYLLIPSGESLLQTNVSCVVRSCPQNISIGITMTE